MNEGYGLAAALVNAFGSSLGFLLAISLMAGIRERIEDNEGIPVSLKGLPMALITAGSMSIAFMGFTGIIK